jgi:hypothetical protein
MHFKCNVHRYTAAAHAAAAKTAAPAGLGGSMLEQLQGKKAPKKKASSAAARAPNISSHPSPGSDADDDSDDIPGRHRVIPSSLTPRFFHLLSSHTHTQFFVFVFVL